MSTQPFWQLGNDAQARKITHADKTQSLSAWAREIGIDSKALRKRLNTWRNTALALTAPAGTKGKAL